MHTIYKNHEPVKFLEGKNKALLLCFENYLYKRTNGKFPKTTWQCVQGCFVTVKTNNGIFEKAVSVSNHHHPPCIDEIKALETNMRIKIRVESEFGLSPRQIHSEERAQLLLNEEYGAHIGINSFRRRRSSLYRYRQAKFPKAPEQRSSIVLTGKWRLTLDGTESFLIADDGDDEKILIFGTENNIRILCNAEYVISDGTFKIHPDIFAQLYVFHAPYLGKVLPLVFCLLPNKTYNTYCRMLQLIQSAASLIGTTFQPRKIHIDYELSMINSITHVFSATSVQGCLFHYCQCIWRKVQELGLAKYYKENKIVRRWIRRFSALPLLPVSDIDEGFIAIHEASPAPSHDSISNEQIEKFHDYMLNTWVHDTDATFPRQLWNHFDNEGPRTTNNAEGWNHKLNQQAKSRLSFYKFIHFLQGIQVDLDSTKIDLITESPGRQSLRCRSVNEGLSIAKKNYTSGSVPILSYLDSISIALKLD